MPKTLIKNVLVRCDGGPGIGMGHVMRCLCLADGLRKTEIQNITFLTHAPDGEARVLDVVRKKIRQWRFRVRMAPPAGTKEDLAFVLKQLKQFSDLSQVLVVTDSYAIGTSYLRQLKASGVKVLSIDDEAKQPFPVDWILNQNMGAEKLSYPKGTTAKRLAGVKYFLLRREFRNIKRPALRKQVLKRLLVTMGGADSQNQTKKVLAALAMLPMKLNVTIVLGGAHPDPRGIRSLTRSSWHKIRIYQDAPKVGSLFKNADAAVTAGGTTSYEVAAMGIPNLILTIADNQRGIARALDRYGSSKSLGWYEDVKPQDIAVEIKGLMHDPQQLRKMSQRAKKLVDGRGVERVVKHICAN